MQIIKQASAGTLESSDVRVTVKPALKPGITVSIFSKLAYQYGESMERSSVRCWTSSASRMHWWN